MLCCGRVWGFRLSEKKENERRSEAEKEQAAELWNSVKKVRLVGKKETAWTCPAGLEIATGTQVGLLPRFRWISFACRCAIKLR